MIFCGVIAHVRSRSLRLRVTAIMSKSASMFRHLPPFIFITVLATVPAAAQMSAPRIY